MNIERNADAIAILIHNELICGVQVGIKKARAKLSALIRTVECGTAVIVTRRGRPVAILVPLDKKRPRTRIGGLAGRPFRMGKGFDRITSSDRLADDYGVARGW